MAPLRTSGSTASPHVRAKRTRRRTEILHAALRAFRDRGYHATTLDDIAERLGVGKTALYHYFPDKEAILYACHQESLAELDRILRGARRLSSATERLAYVIREHVRVMTDTLEGSPLAFEVPALSPERQRPIVAARDRYERALRRTITEGIAAGEFREVEPKIAVFAILGAVNWIARWYRPDGSLHAPELGEQFAEHLVGGLTCG
jgi:TetR/AcrR family transcriptional regulator